MKTCETCKWCQRFGGLPTHGYCINERARYFVGRVVAIPVADFGCIHYEESEE